MKWLIATARSSVNRTGLDSSGGTAGERTWQGARALEQKLVGNWKGQSPCGGRFIFRADGTYELKEYAPPPTTARAPGKCWNALPPTLVLTCKSSEVPEEIGRTTEVKLLRLDDRGALRQACGPRRRTLFASEKVAGRLTAVDVASIPPGKSSHYGLGWTADGLTPRSLPPRTPRASGLRCVPCSSGGGPSSR